MNSPFPINLFDLQGQGRESRKIDPLEKKPAPQGQDHPRDQFIGPQEVRSKEVSYRWESKLVKLILLASTRLIDGPAPPRQKAQIIREIVSEFAISHRARQIF